MFFVENHDAVYIVGSLEETLLIRGMRYHPIDIENTVMRTHKRICEWYSSFDILFLFIFFEILVLVLHGQIFL